MNKDIIKQYIYHSYVNNEYYNDLRYYCNLRTDNIYCNDGEVASVCLFGHKDMTIYNKYSVIGNINQDVNLLVVSFCNGEAVSVTNSKSFKNIKLDSNALTNLHISNGSGFRSTGTDVLLDTDFYTRKQNEELKTILQENSSSGSDTSASVDMTTTNNLLWAIGLILCVTLLLSFLRKIFNRGVK